MKSVLAALALVAICGCASTSGGSDPIEATPVDDADCVNDATVEICVFDPVVGHWACSSRGGAG